MEKKSRKLFGVVLVVVCLITGCGRNPMLAVYDNDAKIASDANTYSLINYEQVQSDLHFRNLISIF